MTYDLAVVGGGIMGASAALAAARRGLRVALLDRGALPDPRAASVDHSKVFRYAYADPLYVELARRAHVLWRDLEHDSGRTLLETCGLVLLGRGEAPAERACVRTLVDAGCEAALLDAQDAVQRFPQLAPRAFSVAALDPSGAIARAADAVRATIELARRHGVSVLDGDGVHAIDAGAVTTESGARVDAGKVLVAAGAWTPRLLPDVRLPIRVTRQEVLYFEPRHPDDFTAERFPIFAELISGFYGFPVHHGRAMKIANHHKGPVADPDDVAAPIGDETACRAFFARFIPGLADARLVETKICFYDSTPDDDFVIDWHPSLPNVLIATGFSGHGFKFGPAVGEIAAELLTTGRSGFSIERFALSRF